MYFNIFIVIALLIVISVAWAFLSLREQKKQQNIVKEAQKKLSTGRVIYQDTGKPQSSDRDEDSSEPRLS